MIRLYLPPLFKRLNRQLTRALEGASGLCVSRSHYEVAIEHILLKAAEDPAGDIQEILRHYELDPAPFLKALQRSIETYKSGNPGKPVFSPILIDLLQEAWLVSSVELGQTELRSGAVFLALAMNPSRSSVEDYTDVFKKINSEDLRKNFQLIVTGTNEDDSPAAAEGGAPGEGAPGPAGAHSRDPESALAKFTVDFTAQARAGKIDAIFERDKEIRQMVDILARRRKNNPIVVGDPGTGKTALVEGLALRIVAGDVPEFLQGVDLLSLDMGLLQAGAGMKGEFEARLKSVLNEVKGSAKPIVLFIDEAHTMIGAGGAAGGSDAANLLKPALARGELRTIAATTWSEYKKYFERDAALSRRFQVVKCDEPSPEGAVTMMRGLRAAYEKSHGVRIRDDAVVASAKLAHRYISGRLLPDKSVDLLDTAAARVRVDLTGKPDALDDAERRIVTIEREIKSLKRDMEAGAEVETERIAELEQQIEEQQAIAADVTERWRKEKAIAERIIELRGMLETGQAPAEAAPEEAPDAEAEAAEGEAEAPPAEAAEPAKLDKAALAEVHDELERKLAELTETQGKHPLIHIDVNPEVIAKVVADWTGIPVGNMVRDEVASILSLAARLQERIKGQDHAIEAISEGIRAAKSGISNPDTPMGVFLLVGPSGVGKTETALALADLLFGGDRFVTTINMSEFQEQHTVSRLVGSPPGYVGYGEGGVLTEAVRQRPYSIVLLDECEKAHLDVLNIFYQVFDKGMLADGEGRIIDFKNTVIFLTSNLATNEIMQLAADPSAISAEDLATQIRPVLSRHFKPALLARMSVVPYFPLFGEAMHTIVKLKLGRLAKRLIDSHKINFDYQQCVVDLIAQRCTEVETGARNIDHILNSTLLPLISTGILEQMSAGELPDWLNLDVGENGKFKLAFSAGNGGAPEPAVEPIVIPEAEAAARAEPEVPAAPSDESPAPNAPAAPEPEPAPEPEQ